MQKESEKDKHAQWLKERERKKLEHERQWRGPYKTNIRTPKAQEEIEPDTTTQQAGTSPLLTSLLKSPSQTPTSSANSARVAAPTITNLLTGSSSSQSSSLASNSPLITQIPSAQNILINASPMASNLINSASVSSVVLSHSHTAPTLIDLLDKKSSLTGGLSQPLHLHDVPNHKLLFHPQELFLPRLRTPRRARSNNCSCQWEFQSRVEAKRAIW
jgi:hypothetical protein